MKIAVSQEGHAHFSWEQLGDVAEGRPNMGENVPVVIYRCLEFALYDVLCHRLGRETADDLMREAGFKTGMEFATHSLDLSLPLDAFLTSLAARLLNLKMGILRVEQLDSQTGEFTLTIAEDLDCSGLPLTGEVVCKYDEGFLAAIFEAYTRQSYEVREIDCWASGYKVCRFRGKRLEKGEISDVKW